MAKMEIVQANPPQQPAPLPVRWDNRELQSGGHLGQEAIQGGEQITNMAKEAFARASAATSDGIYNNAITGAQTALAKAVQQRLSQTTDDKGNPTFATLPQDIATISQGVQQQFGGSILDQDARNRFNLSMNTLATSHVINAMGVARKQQVDFAQGSLNNALNSNVQNALQTGNLDFGYNQSQDQIQQAVKNGYITPQEGDLQSDRIRRGIYAGNLQTMNQTNPVAAKALLDSGTNAQLNITDAERYKLTQENATALRSQQIQQNQIAKEQANVQKQKQIFNYNTMDMQVTHGLVNEPQIDDAYNKGQITIQQQRMLVDKLAAANGETAKQTKTRNNITQDMQDGNDLVGKYTTSDINNYYQWQTKLASDPQTKAPPSLQQKAQIAAGIKAPVPAFTNEIAAVMKSGTNQQKIQAVQALELASSNPLSISKIDKGTLGLISTIQEYQQGSNLDNNTLIANAQSVQLNNMDARNSHTMSGQRLHEFNTGVPDFQPDKIDSTIKSMYKLDGGDSFTGSTGQEVAPSAERTITHLLRDAYLQTGDVGAAKRAVQKETAGVIGVSSVGAGGRLMFAPPEQVYPSIPLSHMQKDLNTAVQASLIKGEFANNTGIDPQSVSIESDQKTYQQMGHDPTYSVMYKDADGRSLPLMNPDTGQPVRWRPGEVDPSKENQDIYNQQKSQGGAVQFGTGATNISPIKSPLSENDPNQSPNLPAGTHPKPNPAPYAPSYPPLNTASSVMMKLKAGVENAEGTKGSYTSLGPVTAKGDQALGKYQVMESNLPLWSREALGREVSRQEFLAHPALQEKVFEYKMNQYMSKYGTIKDALSVWFTGRPYEVAKAAGAKDMLGTTVDKYENDAANGIGRLASNK